jgi:glycosyltransferase involved in cell wall biosynthesis
MPKTLYITTELPYFPGQAGVMALHLGHLSANGVTGVVGPRYPHQPEDALQKLRDTVAHSHWWPEHPQPGPTPLATASSPSVAWVGRLPRRLQRWLLRRLTGLDRYSDDALAWRRVLVNLAPKILEALHTERWNSVLLSQSVSAAWLPYLPATLARCIYFHDIRSDYLQRAPRAFGRRDLRGIQREEREAATNTDAAAFVSELDRTRAINLLHAECPTGVAQLCIDLDYFEFHPVRSDVPPTVLFTGHLSHPPNIDAAVYFLTTIWPRIIAAVPAARCKIVGAHPAEPVKHAVTEATGVDLLANVPDIRPSFRDARVYVVPMRFGGGVRNKILEAWAMGVPVVSTTMGAEGLPACEGKNCWLRDPPADFAAQVADLLKGPPAATVPQAARAYVEQHHSSSASSPQLASLIASATARRRKSVPRVLFDLRWLESGKVGGVEQMTIELLRELGTSDRDFEYRLYGRERTCRALRFPRGFKHQIVSTDGPEARRRAWRNACINQLTSTLGEPPLTSEALQALDLYTRLDFTVVHGMPCYVHPDLRRFPSIVTMHDLQHLHYPEYFSEEDITTREREYRESCLRADHLICVSEFTRQDVHRRYGIPLEKMSTIWNLPPSPTTFDRGLIAAMGVRWPFLFYPAQPWLHKNHLGLLRAMRDALRELPAETHLVLTGQPFPIGHPARELLEAPELCGRVVHLGYRTSAEVAALYASAEALVFASRFEGFGMPVIEAMSHSCPVICGTHTSLPEIAGDAAHFVDVESPGALAEAMIAIGRDPGLRDRLRQKGRANVTRFDRRKLAGQTRAIYAMVHERHFS